MKKLITCTLAILLITLLTSCTTSTEYVSKPVVPGITFPIFPALENETINTDGSVTVPAEWIVRLAEYKIRIKETESNYNDLKALYENDYSRE